MTVVPFGKYKDRPIEDMLADADYMTWLEAQPWFRDRFSHLLVGRDADAASRTPVHNRLQALFLDDVYRSAFSAIAAPKRWEIEVEEVETNIQADLSSAQGRLLKAEKEAAEEWEAPYWIDKKNEAEINRRKTSFEKSRRDAEKDVESLRNHIADLISERVKYSTVAFERDGADVMISCAYRTAGQWKRGQNSSFSLAVEIKPTVADEYPAVLRQMGRNRTKFLFVGQYTGEGVTERQFVAIFAASGVRVIFKRDVDALVG